MRLSRHEQAHGLTVRRLDRVDSHYVSPFEGTFGLMTYQTYTPPGLYSEAHTSEE